MAFQAKGSITQSADGAIETYHDDSTYGQDGITLNNILGRTLVSYNADNSIYLSQAITAGSLTADIPITEDLVLRHVNTITLANSTTKVATTNFLSTRFYDLLQRESVNSIKCNCATNKALCSNRTKARECKDAAETSLSIGDLINAQLQIGYANDFINESTESCSC